MQEWMTLKTLTNQTRNAGNPELDVIPNFGKWMSTKYNWHSTELENEEDLGKAYQFIANNYVEQQV